MKMTSQFKYVIIGASQAGLTAAETLRSKDKESTILLISDEMVPPYKRTELSKHLFEKLTAESFIIHPKCWYTENRISLFTNSKVTMIDPQQQCISLKKGQKIYYQELLIATGAQPRRLEIPGGEYIYYLRNRKDMELIQKECADLSSVLVIGGGVEGVELADQFYRAGKRVTLVTASHRIMDNLIDQSMSANLSERMKSKGILLYENCPIERLEPKGSGFQVHCGSSHHYTEMVVASTGIIQQPGPALKLGICGEKGILVNQNMETSLPHIYAAGDVLELPKKYCWGLWHAAQYQGETAALNMAGYHEKLDTRSYRLKTEVFDCFIYSHHYSQSKDSGESPVIISEKDQYLRFFADQGKTSGALMVNMKEKAKALQQQIQNHVPYQEILKNLEIPGL